MECCSIATDRKSIQPEPASKTGGFCFCWRGIFSQIHSNTLFLNLNASGKTNPQTTARFGKITSQGS
jgi:hypothetical protein